MKTLGKYELLGELGRGAFGVVYRARDPIINRMVALKTMSTYVADNPGLLQRFYREAQSAGSLQHPNIVTIYDMGEEAGTPFIAMELIDGQNLDDLIAGHPDLPVSLKLVYAVQTSRALDFAHKRGIIHRDIKPGNVMVNKEGTVKVVDFGIARVLETSKTQTGMLIGTFSYMAPEVFHGEHASARSDIWSFGVLLYELLTYRRPFGGESPAALMKSVCFQEPVPLRQLAPECPEDLESVVHRMLVKSERERFQTMEDVLLELEPIAKRLHAETLDELLAQSRQLVEQQEFEQARRLLRQVLQVDSGNTQARLLSEKVNVELKRISVRPRAEEHVAKGRALLQNRKLQEANAEAGNALALDSLFEPALELQREVLREIERSHQISTWLELLKQRLVEGLPEEAEALLAKVREIDPSNCQLPPLQQQVLEEKARRQSQMRLFDAMQRARGLWTQRKYRDCISLLTQLQKEFPGEEDVDRLLETAREDQAEQNKQEKLTGARNLLTARRYGECIAVLTKLQADFPIDDEIRRLLETARADQAEQRKDESLAEARNLLTARRYEECIALLSKLQEEFAGDLEIHKLLEAARQDQAEQHKRDKLAEARKLLSARRYEPCLTLLAKLQEEFPQDEEIRKLLEIARQDQAEFHRKQKLSEVRDLLAAQRFAEAMAALEPLLAADPQDSSVQKLRSLVQREQEKQARLQTLQREWESLKKLVSERAYPEVVARGEALLHEFPGRADLVRLVEFSRGQQAQADHELRLRKSLDEVQAMIQAGRFGEASAAARAGLESFPDNAELASLLQDAQAREKKEKMRLLIERRVREIKVKINAGQLTEAKDLAKDTLVAMGPDTDVRQLLTSAEVEHEAREKRRKQDQKLETIRTLVRSGKLDEAASTLDEVMTSGDFHVLDPRLYQVAHEIEGARKAATMPVVAHDPAGPTREYAILEGPPGADASPAATAPAMPPTAPPAESTSMSGTVAWRNDTLPMVEKQLATFIGPVARIMVKKAASRATDPEDLYNLLAANLESETDRQAFLARKLEVSQVSMQSSALPEPSIVGRAATQAIPVSAEFTRDVIERAVQLLAPHVGPIAWVLARRAAQRADSVRSFYQLLAQHLDRKAERARFLRDAGFPDS
jgi:serine/threonine protein kinase